MVSGEKSLIFLKKNTSKLGFCNKLETMQNKGFP